MVSAREVPINFARPILQNTQNYIIPMKFWLRTVMGPNLDRGIVFVNTVDIVDPFLISSNDFSQKALTEENIII